MGLQYVRWRDVLHWKTQIIQGFLVHIDPWSEEDQEPISGAATQCGQVAVHQACLSSPASA